MASSTARFIAPLRERDGDDCQLCQQPIDFTLPYPDPMSRTVDHIRPRSAGGPTTLTNLRLAHWACNNRRGAVWSGKDYDASIPRLVRKKNPVSRRSNAIPVNRTWDSWAAARQVPGGLVIGDEPVADCS